MDSRKSDLDEITGICRDLIEITNGYDQRLSQHKVTGAARGLFGGNKHAIVAEKIREIAKAVMIDMNYEQMPSYEKIEFSKNVLLATIKASEDSLKNEGGSLWKRIALYKQGVVKVNVDDKFNKVASWMGDKENHGSYFSEDKLNNKYLTTYVDKMKEIISGQEKSEVKKVLATFHSAKPEYDKDELMHAISLSRKKPT